MKRPSRKRAAAVPKIDDNTARAIRKIYSRIVRQAPLPLWFWWWHQMPEGLGKKRFGKLLLGRPKGQSKAKWAAAVRAYILGSRKLCEIIFMNLHESVTENRKATRSCPRRTRKPLRR
jgi:hypothetical protein